MRPARIPKTVNPTVWQLLKYVASVRDLVDRVRVDDHSISDTYHGLTTKT